MKNTLLLTIITFFLLHVFNESKACVDPDPTKRIIVTINYDTLEYLPAPWIFNVEMRISNLRLMDETPNKFCSCALTSIPLADIQYVAFVDSGTNNPYNGFSLFDSLKAASNDWDATSSYLWAGFVSDVINGGLKATSSVEMVVRYELSYDTINGGYTKNGDTNSTSLKSVIDSLGNLGTDEWNPTSQSLVNAHRGIREFKGKTSYFLKPASYFQMLDTMILNNIPSDTSSTGLFENIQNDLKAQVFPNPFENELTLYLNISSQSDVNIIAFDYLGKQVMDAIHMEMDQGVHNIKLTDLKAMDSGIYYLHISSGDQNKRMKLIKQ